MRVSKPGITAGPEDTTISFEGRPVPARSGESLAAALIAAGQYAFRRTATTGERGVFCGMGVCSECALQVSGEAGRLACMERVVPGLQLELNPPARRLDLSAPPASPDALPEEVRDTDVLVVGAGPAGLRAAVAASRAGAKVLVVDERAASGGQYLKQPAGSLEVDEQRLDAQYRTGRALVSEAEECGVELLRGTRVWGSSENRELYAVSRAGRYVFRGRALVLTTGAFERGVPFPGWTLPGVMTTGAAQTLLRSYLVAPGSRVLVAGNGPLNLQVAAELVAAGVRVVAVVEAAALYQFNHALHLGRMSAAAPRYALEGLGYLRTLARSRVPVLSGPPSWRWPGTVGHRWLSWPAWTRTAGPDRAAVASRSMPCASGRALSPRASWPARSAANTGSTSGPGRWSQARPLGTDVGGRHLGGRRRRGHRRRPGGPGDGDARRARCGDLLGAAPWRRAYGAAPSRPAGTGPERTVPALPVAPLLCSPPMDQLATPETVICRCEEVTLGELTAATTPWLAAAGSLKRATRAGMGKCQGRYCSPVLVALAARESGRAIGPFSGFAPQWPVTPVAVSAVAAGTVDA